MKNSNKLLCLLLFVVMTYSCGEDEPKTTENTYTPTNTPPEPAFIEVTEFIRGQLYELSSMPITPLHTITKDGHIDSTWIKRESLEQYAAPFLKPVIDSALMAAFYKESSFLDQTINAYTFTYEPAGILPDSINIRNWVIYIDPNTSSIKRVYIVKAEKTAEGTIIKHLTWKSDSWFSINTFMEGTDIIIKNEKVTWNFDEKSDME